MEEIDFVKVAKDICDSISIPYEIASGEFRNEDNNSKFIIGEDMFNRRNKE